MLLGWMACVAGLVGLVAVTRNSPYWELFPCFLAAGFGISFAMMAATAAVMETAPAARAGLASAAVNAARQLGGMLGVALLGSLVVSRLHFMGGMHVAMGIAGGAFAIALLITFLFVQPSPSTGAS
jgi:MFS transporter, DHA2 family, methylenomycin A resistance protein